MRDDVVDVSDPVLTTMRQKIMDRDDTIGWRSYRRSDVVALLFGRGAGGNTSDHNARRASTADDEGDVVIMDDKSLMIK